MKILRFSAEFIAKVFDEKLGRFYGAHTLKSSEPTTVDVNNIKYAVT